jgi:hypothetical protein
MILKDEKKEKKSIFDYEEEPLMAQYSSSLYSNNDIDIKLDNRKPKVFISKSSKSVDQELILEN